jgi:hypothetical protein
MTCIPAPLNAYSTYPNSTPNYYGFPQFPDVLGNLRALGHSVQRRRAEELHG